MADELPPETPAPATPAAPAAPAVPGAPGVPAGEVTRSVEVDAHLADVWRSVADPGERALWLDDPDATARRIRVDESTPGHRLVWTWWPRDDEGDASTVSVVLTPAAGGGTRVVVTETVPATLPLGGAPRAASGQAGSGRAAPEAAVRGLRRAPSWVRCAHDRWDGRLLGLELLFVAARAGVA